MQIRPNFPILTKGQNKILATKPNGQIFAIRTPGFPVLGSGVLYLAVSCMPLCYLCNGSKNHIPAYELHRLYTQSHKFKNVHIATWTVRT